MNLREPLPTVPVPLKAPDPDVPLDVQGALNVIYDEAQYGLTLKYEEMPPAPILVQEDLGWIRKYAQELQKASLVNSEISK